MNTETGRISTIEEMTKLSDIERAREYQECKVFVDHIKAHLHPSQFVVCKICNKTINDIWHEALKETNQ